jgi:putative zinc finger/helix-turn-helix YgiT family protein
MKASIQSQRKFPRTCVACREKQVRRALIDRVAEVKYEGKLYKVKATKVPVERCENCGSTTYGVESEERIDAALRDQLGLLQPQVIRKNRSELGLKQEQFASALGCAGESISRWESGAIVQSRAVDRMLRAYFELPQLREFLKGLNAAVSKGEFAGAEVRWAEPASENTASTLVPAWASLVGLARRASFRKSALGPPSRNLSTNQGPFPICKRYDHDSVA